MKKRASRLLLFAALLSLMNNVLPADDRAPDAVVRVAALRGFQGLFEWAPGPDGVAPGTILGGRWFANGTIIDLAGIARQLKITPGREIETDDVYVLTTLRSVHVADEIWLRGVVPVRDRLDAVMEVPASLIASDAALNLALLKGRQPPGGPGYPPGLLLTKAPISRGQEVVRVHVLDWRTVQRRDQLWSRGLPRPSHDPFRLDSLPTWWTLGRVNSNEAGGPLLDPVSNRLVGVVGTTQRQVRARGGGTNWRGGSHVVEAERIASFLRSALAGRPPTHGTLAGGGPRTQRVEPSLAALLGLPSATGLYALGDWPVEHPLVRRGDILLRLGGMPLGHGGVTIAESVFDIEPGATTTLAYRRGSENAKLELPVVKLDRPTGNDIAWVRFAGAWIQQVPPGMYLEGYDRSGPVVVYVDPGSPAEAGGIEFGMVIHDVLGAGRSLTAASVAELSRALQAITATPGFDGRLGLRVNDLNRPGDTVRIVLVRTEPGAAVEESAP